MGIITKLVFISIFASLVVAFYGDEIVRVVDNESSLAKEAIPREVTYAANIVNSVQIPQQRDGHYWLDAGVNHTDVTFIVDTGASNVTLSFNDAKGLGLPYFENDFNVLVNTAAGQTEMASVTLDSVRIGNIELYDVDALIAKDGMLSVSLLGMNFLNRLTRFEFSDQRLILEQ